MSSKVKPTFFKNPDNFQFICNVVLFFIIFYLCLFLLSPLIIFLVLFRLIVTLILLAVYPQRFTLMNGSDALYAAESYANVRTITLFVYIKGPCHISELRQRFHNNFVKLNENGRYPYEKMLSSIVSKFGFLFWENKRNSFDICHHVYECPPEISSPSKVCTEAEVHDLAAQRLDQLWNDDHPRWEAIVVPKMKICDSDEIQSAIIFRMHHSYGDGISGAQIIRAVIADPPTPQISFDPVNPPIPKIPWYVQGLWWVQVFFIGPYLAFRQVIFKEKHVYFEGPLQGGKHFGRINVPVTIQTMRTIRSAFGVCTNGVMHAAFVGALRESAERKGFKEIPAEIIGGTVFASYPYPDNYLHNRACFGGIQYPIGVEDPIQRLSACNEAYVKLGTSIVEQMTSSLMQKLLGILPTALVWYLQF